MGGIFRAVGNVVGSVLGFGGGGGGTTTHVYQPAQSAPASAAAPAMDSAQRAITEDTQVKKKRRGKAGLLIKPTDKDSGTGGGTTGLNL